MKKAIIKATSIAIFGLSMSVCFGQSSSKTQQTKMNDPDAIQKAKPKAESRTDRIWAAAMDRVNYQNDVWFNSGDFLRSINALRFVNDIFPGDWEIATNLGWLLESTENYDGAVAVYSRYKDLNITTDPDAPWPLANFYFKKKQYDKVPSLLEPSMKLSPHPNSYRILAHAYERLKKYKDSARTWDSLIGRYPDDRAAIVNRDRVKKKLAAG